MDTMDPVGSVIEPTCTFQGWMNVHTTDGTEWIGHVAFNHKAGLWMDRVVCRTGPVWSGEGPPLGGPMFFPWSHVVAAWPRAQRS